MPTEIQIGVVAHRTGLSVDAIRFYEKEGLLNAPARTAGGFRLFRAEDVEALGFIRSAQELGFSLDEIRDLLSLRKGASRPCGLVERLLERKLASVQERIARLSALEAELRQALEECKQALGRKRPTAPDGCPVLEHLAHGLHSVATK